jgi:hypothetical protein
VDYVMLSDLVRYYVVIAALWLVAVLLRITYKRLTRCDGGWRCLFRRQESPHPFSTLGLAVLMTVAIIRRFDALGTPGDVYLWLVFTGVTLVLLGVLVNVHFTLKPPWRRH